MDYKNIKKKGQVDPNSPEFLNEFEKYFEPTSPKKEILADDTVKMQPPKNIETSEDFLENKKNTEQARNKTYSEKYYGQNPLTEEEIKKLQSSGPVIISGEEPTIRKKGTDVSKYIGSQQALGNKLRKKQEVRDAQVKLEEDVAQRKKFGLKQPAKELASQSLEKPSRFSRILKALGMRGSKAIPILGAGMGALSAKEALARGDKLGAALETASMVDPTPISDIVLAGKDIYDIVTEKDDTEKTMKPMIKAIGGEPDMNPKKADELAGEQDSPDSDAASAGLNILNEQTRRQKKLGYNF